MAQSILQGLFARLRGALLVVAATGLVAPAQAESQQEAENATWESAQQAGTFDAYQKYLESFPTGRHASLAFKRMIELAAGDIVADGAPRGVNATLY